jgi:hypothetical protein
MIKAFITMSLAAASSFNLFGQEQTAETGFYPNRFIIQGGIGAGTGIGATFGLLKDYIDLNTKVKVPYFIKAEYAVHKNIGIGVNFARSGADFSFNLPDTVRVNGVAQLTNVDLQYRSWSIMPRINVHFFPASKADLYFGLGIGWRQNNFKISTNNEAAEFTIPLIDYKVNAKIPKVGFGTLGMDATLGFRYFITPNLGLYTELGMAKGFIQAGGVLAF